MNPQELAAGMALVVKETIGARLAELKAEIERNTPDIAALVAAEVDKRMAELPKPPEPAPAFDATGVAEIIDETIERIARLEQDKADQPDVGNLVSTEVAKQLAAIPAPPAPQPGRDGRDAAELVILPAIDAQKSYLRGTWASHAGGLWLAKAQTDGMAGWECMVDGLASVTAELAEDARTVEIRTVKASGAHSLQRVAIPTMVYKDIYREGRIYTKGDTVTWAGHMWICKQETDAKPVEGDNWRIAVKRGQDARALA